MSLPQKNLMGLFLFSSTTNDIRFRQETVVFIGLLSFSLSFWAPYSTLMASMGLSLNNPNRYGLIRWESVT